LTREEAGMADGLEQPHPVESDILRLLEAHGIGELKTYRMGSVLYWQGDPVDHVFVIESGAVKVSSISRDGRVRIHGIFGAGRLLGANAYLLGSEHKSIAEHLRDSQVRVIDPGDFEKALSEDPDFSAVVMHELALEVSSLSDQMRDLSFLDVQQRLRNSLVRLAQEHGLETEDGIKIDLRITHEEIGALVAANRTTITAHLARLKRMGYLWTEGQRLVIIPPEHMDILDNLGASVIDGDDQGARFWAQRAAEKGIEPFKVLDALTAGMRQVDRDYSRRELELPDVVLAAYAMKDTLPIVEAQIENVPQEVSVLGTVVIGTVFGDIHDIGKTIVSMLLKARGFHVIDLGVNVTTGQFLEAVRECEPDILAMSALTTATSLEIARVIQALEEDELRDRVKVMVGGGAVTRAQARALGANGYHATARGAVEEAWRLCTWE
jgi:5-methyltetrahydrofolate--homocysteine methyltransferase